LDRRLEPRQQFVVSGALGSVSVTLLIDPKNLAGSIAIIDETGTVRVGGVAVNEIQHWEFGDRRREDEQVKSASYETPSVYGVVHPLYYGNAIKVLRGAAASHRGAVPRLPRRGRHRAVRRLLHPRVEKPGQTTRSLDALQRRDRRRSPNVARCYACRLICNRPGVRTRHRIERTVAAMAHRIVRRFRPEKAILFGSHLAGRAGPDSDADLRVVMPLTASKAAHELEIRAALRAYPTPKDVIVTTPETFAWRRAVPGTIERSAARSGRVLYEKR
jgi:predicted nucleotidyltransferase